MVAALDASAVHGWPVVSFGKVAIAQSDRGQRLKQRDYLAEGAIPVIDQGQALIGGYTNDEDAAFAGELPVVLFGDHTRAVKLIQHRFAVGADGIKIFKPADGVRAKYLYYWMKSAPIPNRGYGRHYQYLRGLSVPLPPPEQQDEIVAELEKQFSRLDEAVANLKRVKANLKRYKASVLKDAVEGRLVPTEAELARREGRSYETGEQLLQRILEARRSIREGKGRYKEPIAPELVGSDLPEGWTWATMEQLGQVQLGKMLDKQKHLLGEPHRYLRNINVRWGAFDLSDLFEMNFESTQLERFGIRDGDVLVCEGGEPARAAVWRMGATDIKYQKALHRVRFDGAFVPELLMFTLEHLAKSGALEEMYGGSTIKHFTREVFVTLRVPVPPFAEQLRIVNEVERQLSIISAAEDQVNLNLARSTRLRQSVLASAFGQSVEGGSGNIVKEEDHTMKTGKLPALPAARKSEAEDYRQDLVIALKRHPGGISAEQLFQEAGYRGDQVDAYYRDLALISAQLVQVLPDVDGRDWPASGSVLIQLKA